MYRLSSDHQLEEYLCMIIVWNQIYIHVYTEYFSHISNTHLTIFSYRTRLTKTKLTTDNSRTVRFIDVLLVIYRRDMI